MSDLPENIGDEALMLLTEIVEERGQWVVYLEIVFPDRTVRHRIQAYSKKRLAEIAAQYIRRGASREKPFVSEGL